MKIISGFSDLFVRELGPSLHERLASMFPEGVSRRPSGPFVRIRVPIDDPRFQLALRVLADAGFTQDQLDGNFRPKNYVLRYLVQYEPAECEAAEYLQPVPHEDAWCVDFTKDQAGRLCIEGEKSSNWIPAGHDVIGLAVQWQHLLIGSRVKRILEKASLSHVVINEALWLDPEDDPVPWPDEPFWELTSNLLLPPAIQQVHIRDAPWHQSQHVRRIDIRASLPFDLAMVPYSKPDSYRQFLIASRAFYRTCVDHNINFDWVPVSIND